MTHTGVRRRWPQWDQPNPSANKVTDRVGCLSSGSLGLKATVSRASQARPSPTRVSPPGIVRIAAPEFQKVLYVLGSRFPHQEHETTNLRNDAWGALGCCVHRPCRCPRGQERRGGRLACPGYVQVLPQPDSPARACWQPRPSRSPRSTPSADQLRLCPSRSWFFTGDEPVPPPGTPGHVWRRSWLSHLGGSDRHPGGGGQGRG